MEIEVQEEVAINTTIGVVQAVDDDLGENADIEYALTDGNDDKIFMVLAFIIYFVFHIWYVLIYSSYPGCNLEIPTYQLIIE